MVVLLPPPGLRGHRRCTATHPASRRPLADAQLRAGHRRRRAAVGAAGRRARPLARPGAPPALLGPRLLARPRRTARLRLRSAPLSAERARRYGTARLHDAGGPPGRPAATPRAPRR